MCRDNLFDNVDANYAFDDVSILRKIMNIFSIRPTILETSVNPMFTLAQKGYNVSHLNMNPALNSYVTMKGGNMEFINQPIGTITKVPMLKLNIPNLVQSQNVDGKTIRIEQVFEQQIPLFIKNSIVPASQKILDSDDVLIICVNRKIQQYNIKGMSSPVSFNYLPMILSGYDRINNFPVNVSEFINLEINSFQIRSVCAVTETVLTIGAKQERLISGSVGLIRTVDNYMENTTGESYLYDPLGASMPVKLHTGDNAYTNNKPISIIPETSFGKTDELNREITFFDFASTNGSVYIYTKILNQ
jgi:hypothetical protein